MNVGSLLQILEGVPADTEVTVLFNGAAPTSEHETDGAYYLQKKKDSNRVVIDVFVKSRKSPRTAKRSK